MGRPSRLDPGFATRVDWSVNRPVIMEERNKNWESLEGNQVYFDIVVGGKTHNTMRLVFALFMDEVPLAAANFHALCTQRFQGLGEGGQPLTFKRSGFHRVCRDQFLQGGDITRGEGGGGDSIYGAAGFEDETLGLRMRHSGPGLLTMANHGPDTNRSQFMITLGAAPELDGKHVIFGRVISGAFHLETLGAVPVDGRDAPAQPVVIVECGAIPGWHRAALPMPDSVERHVTKDRLAEEAQQQRSAVADAVSAALKRTAPAGAEAPQASKRPAAEGGARGSSSGMMALPIAGLEEGDEDDSDEDEES